MEITGRRGVAAAWPLAAHAASDLLGAFWRKPDQ